MPNTQSIADTVFLVQTAAKRASTNQRLITVVAVLARCVAFRGLDIRRICVILCLD